MVMDDLYAVFAGAKKCRTQAKQRERALKQSFLQNEE
jgi:hypothetical protein